MIRSTLAVMAVVATLGSQAEAAVYTSSQDVIYGRSDADSLIANAFVPNFDSSRGVLNQLTFTLFGFATQQTSYYQSARPSSGTFQNYIQFNNSAPVLLSTSVVTPANFLSASTLQENFAVNASASYAALGYVQPGDTSISLSYSLGGPVVPIQCCAYTSVQFRGTLTTTYDYTPVPEPISLALLSAPVVALGLIRRRG